MYEQNLLSTPPAAAAAALEARSWAKSTTQGVLQLFLLLPISLCPPPPFPFPRWWWFFLGGLVAPGAMGVGFTVSLVVVHLRILGLVDGGVRETWLVFLRRLLWVALVFGRVQGVDVRRLAWHVLDVRRRYACEGWVCIPGGETYVGWERLDQACDTW